MLTLIPMRLEDLDQVARWLQEPHVSRWWLTDTDVASEVEKYRARILDQGSPTHMVIALLDGVPMGFAQWYRWDDYPDHAVQVGARSGEVGIDYAIGDPSSVGKGLGQELIAAIAGEARLEHPGASVVVDPDAENVASRRCLENLGFTLLGERPSAASAGEGARAIYRLHGATHA